MPLSIRARLHDSPATSKELQTATGLSQAAVSRQLRAMGERIIRIKSGRSVRYALTRDAFGSNDKLPLYSVDPHGNTVGIAQIRPLAHGGFMLTLQPGSPAVLLGEAGNGLYDDLPWFLDDLRPQGFLGRQIAADLAELATDFPADPKLWNSEHVGRYLVANGDDLSGNFKLGHQAHLRVRRRPVAITSRDYPTLADAVMAGEPPGSSAGGEQPKFTAYHAERGHVIVKFSPPDQGAVARRWRDILITEHHAAEVLHEQGLPAAETRLVDAGGRLFLESQRFDRRGEFGRLSMLSLQTIDAEFIGQGSHWPTVMQALARIQLVHPQHVDDALTLWAFGRLINNTDMHLGNLSLAIDGDIFRLLPVYDMCAMGFAPRSGEVLPLTFTTPDIGENEAIPEEILTVATDMANRFWKSLTNDPRISVEFQRFLQTSNLGAA